MSQASTSACRMATSRSTATARARPSRPRRRCGAAAARARRSALTIRPARRPACPRRRAGPSTGGPTTRRGGGPGVVTGATRGHADVLLVHPAVHDADVHELAVRAPSPTGLGAGLVEAGPRARPQLGTGGGAVTTPELLRHVAPGGDRAGAPPTPRCGPRPRCSTWAGSGDDRSGAGVAQQRPLGAHHVRQHVAHRPARALRRQVPLDSPRPAQEGQDGLPLLGQDLDDRLFCSHGHADLLAVTPPGPRPASQCGVDRPLSSRSPDASPGRRRATIRAWPPGPGIASNPTPGGGHSEEDERGFVRGLLCEMP